MLCLNHEELRLLAAFPQKSRKFIDKRPDGKIEVISKISVNAAFSKMDSEAHPLLHLYCEDDIAKYIINNLCVEINKTHKHFNRLINVICSGAVNQVHCDYTRHKRNYNQFRQKIGYACVFDGDYKNDPLYSHYHENNQEFSYFLYPYTAPEKFLINAYLANSPHPQLISASALSDHHSLFQVMVTLGLCSDISQAREYCWSAFKSTPEYEQLKVTFNRFIINTVSHFSGISD